MTQQHEEAIKQLQDTTTLHQQAINSMQTDITTMKIAINDIIRFTSEIATKLGFQITLPPPLPLSRATPTPPLVATAAMDFMTPDPSSKLPATPSNFIATAPSSPKSPTSPICLPSFTPTSHQSDSTHFGNILSNAWPREYYSALLQRAVPRPDCKVLNSYVNVVVAVREAVMTAAVSNSGLLYLMNNTFMSMKKEQCERKLYVFDPGGSFTKVAKLFDEMLERNEEKILEKALFVFDPGGMFTVKSISDLEDKVDFEGMVMIR